MEQDYQSLVLGGVTALEDEGIHFSRTELEFAGEIAYDQWERLTGKLLEVEQSNRWWLGDALNYGSRVYGEKYSQALDATGLSYESLVDYAYVARAVDPSVRTEELSWTHHKVVSKMPTDVQRTWLRFALTYSLTSRELRAVIKAAEDAADKGKALDGKALLEAIRGDDLKKLEEPAPADHSPASYTTFQEAAQGTLGDSLYYITSVEQMHDDFLDKGTPWYVDLEGQSREEDERAVYTTLASIELGELPAAIMVSNLPFDHNAIAGCIQAGALVCLTGIGWALYLGDKPEQFVRCWHNFGPVLRRVQPT